MKEIEAKFLVSDLEVVRSRIERLGGRLMSERHLERNLRFDLPDRSLSKSQSVLRLRQDETAWLTLKRPLASAEEREEIEIEVNDAEAAKQLLEGLGYRLFAIYEKWRAEYSLGKSRVMLDELPFGQFVEIEGPSLADVEGQAAELGLDWKRRSDRTYLQLIEALTGSDVREATFERLGDRPPIDLSRFELEDALTEFEHNR